MKRLYFFIFSLIAIFLFSNAQPIIVASSNMAKIKSTFDSPDFNYPQTVIDNADVMLNNAISSQKGETMVLALIQSSLAKSMISNDSLPVIIDKIENIAGSEKDKCIKSTLYLLEAKILNSYYNSNKYKLARRSSILAESNDIFEWNENQFLTRISLLIDKALYEKNALKSAKITEFSKIVSISPEAVNIYPTMYDFIVYQCVDIYHSWSTKNFYNPFAKVSSNNSLDYSQKVQAIFDSLLSSHAKGSLPYIVASISKLDFNHFSNTNFDIAGPQKELKKLYNTYKNSEYIAPVILKLDDDTKVLYQIYSDFLNKYPKSIFAASIEKKKLQLEKKDAVLRFDRYITSADSIMVECAVKNVNEIEVAIYPTENSSYIRNTSFSKKKPIATRSFAVNGTVPFSDTLNISMPPLDYGCYTIIAYNINNNGKKETFSNDNGVSTFIVTDISSFTVVNQHNKSRHIFAIDAISGKPLSGVNISSEPQNKKYKVLKETTQKDGSISIPNSTYRNFNFSNGNDKYFSWSSYNYFYSQNDSALQYVCNIYTDFAIYRPGDTIRMTAVCNRANAFKKELARNLKVKATLVDANYDSISSVSLITDEMGRICHDFIIPTNRLNGDYTIQLQKDVNQEYLASHRISISEYKIPTFYIEFIDEKQSYSENGNITLKGIVKTFNGLPLSNTTVQCELQSGSWYDDFSNLANIIVPTDEMGIFYVTFDASEVKSRSNYPITRYRLIASVTNKVGETQKCNSMAFFIGESVVMNWDSNNNLNKDASQKVNLPISIISNEENAPQSYPCILTLSDKNNKIVVSIPFESNNPAFDFSSIPSGEYTINAWLEKDSSVRIGDKKIILYRPTDTASPINSALWTPDTELEYTPGSKVSLLLGSSFDNSHIYYTISYLDKIVKQGWTVINKGISHFDYTMPKDMLAGEKVLIQLYSVRNRVKKSYDISVYAKIKTAKAELTIESFRDRIIPNSHEKWTLHLTRDGKPVVNGAIISAMTDKAINSLQNNEWTFYQRNIIRNTYTAFYGPYSVSKARNQFDWNNFIDKRIQKLNEPTLSEPTLNLFGQSFFARNIRIRGLSYTSSNDKAQTLMYSKNSSEESTGYDARDVRVSNNAEIDNSLNSVPLRTENKKTVFWQPMLTTDENGNAIIEFDVPNMNTTWQFQAVGYDQDLNATTILRNIVASKPIMVNPNLPRFLRQGDKATIMTSIQNATDSIQSCNAIIELFNPFTDEVYLTRSFVLNIEKQKAEPMSIAYLVPDTINSIGFRVKASNGTFSDGEQSIIPILSSVSPVIESKPFYITPEERDFTLELPSFPKNASITFEYCNNPIWYVATALPSINSNDNTTAIQLAHSIFANLVAMKVITNNPEIEQAIDYWKKNPQDSALVSMLSKNQNLKIGTLLASPWIKDSEEQTLRMSQLDKLFDNTKSQTATDALIKKLSELQLNDGGFVWYKYPNAKSSIHTTLSVLQVIGRIKSLNALGNNSELSSIISKAINYIDNKLIESYNKQKNKSDYSGYLQYAYTRSLFMDIKMNKNFEDLYEKILDSLAQEWKGMNIANKAFTTITLANFERISQARLILESINQFSIYNPKLGRYWDNIQSSWFQFYSKVAITSLILQAYHMLEPKAEEIDQIRQWLLLEKQTSDWGNSSLAAEAVYAILNTGNDWLKTAQFPIFKLNGTAIEMNKVDQILGYGKMQLNIDNSTRENYISIENNDNNPSWGAVYCQYKSHMKDIKATSVNELSIKKEIINYSGNDTLKIGDKIQVRLIVKNSKELEYVTITDERAACFEPAEQISGHKYEDATGYYIEIKDSSTNLFFNNLQKGTHIFTYDIYVTNSGDFNSGIASAQCQYAPQITAHSAGKIISVK